MNPVGRPSSTTRPSGTLRHSRWPTTALAAWTSRSRGSSTRTGRGCAGRRPGHACLHRAGPGGSSAHRARGWRADALALLRRRPGRGDLEACTIGARGAHEPRQPGGDQDPRARPAGDFAHREQVDVDFTDRPATIRPVRCPDIALARSTLGWDPTVPLGEGLTRTLAWAKEMWT